MSNLTIKQEKFILKYFECGNATEAYRFAYRTLRMKDKQINEEASKLLNEEKNPKVAQRLKELKEKAQKESEWNVQKLIKAQTRIFEIGIGDVASSHMVSEGMGDGMTQTLEVNLRDTNLASAKGALVEIGKLIGAYEKDNKQKTGLDLGEIAKKVFDGLEGK